jgi:hypothetical protein
VSISGSGERVAVGAIDNDDAASGAGMVQIYQYDPGPNNGSWTSIGTFYGDAAGDSLGYSVSLNYAGFFLAMGAPHNAAGGADAGMAKVFYSPNSPTSSPTTPTSRPSVAPTPAGKIRDVQEPSTLAPSNPTRTPTLFPTQAPSISSFSLPEQSSSDPSSRNAGSSQGSDSRSITLATVLSVALVSGVLLLIAGLWVWKHRRGVGRAKIRSVNVRSSSQEMSVEDDGNEGE